MNKSDTLNKNHYSGRDLSAWGFALLIAIAFAWIGIGGQIETYLKNSREQLISQPASGELIVIEVDAQSLQELEEWPWPRARYAKAVEELNKAGVSQIAFDIDFSSRSDRANDQAFASAIEQSEATVILPTFRQLGSVGSSEYVESLPLPILAEHAFLGSVNVHPDENGQLNQYSYGTVTARLPRPSLASMLSDTSGVVGTSFAINQSIDPATIPRISFADLIQGKSDPALLSGKKVLVGATAIELGDRYPVRHYGVLPGVIIQALATETLIQDAVLDDFGPYLPLTVAAIFLFMAFKIFRVGHMLIASAAIGASLSAALIFLEANHIATFSNIPMLVFLGAFLIFRKFFDTSTALRKSQNRNSLSGLPNETSFAHYLSGKQQIPVIVARISNFRDVMALTDAPTRSQIYSSLSDRLKFLALDETVYHLDADSFGWVAKDCNSNTVANHCQTASALFQAPFLGGSSKFKLNPVFGVSMGSIEQSKIAADQASAKNQRWSWHDDRASDAISMQQRLLVDLERSIDSDDIYPVYQPKLDMQTRRITSVEALVRWEHSELGPISPDMFIPLLERENRIDELTLRMIHRSLYDRNRWKALGHDLTCSINISAPLLSDRRFVELAIAEVMDSGVEPEKVIFEVTESATLADQDVTVQALIRIRDAGIKVSIDDYGTGQSTLSYLQRLPADEIKIDQSFVKNLVQDKGTKVLVQSTIQMAQALELKVVAEGIEDAECLELLATLGCNMGQGWFIAKPLLSDDLIALLNSASAKQDKTEKKSA